ncbi:MAG: hypothetical protein AAGB28_14150, partial [Pseudomonadota bacterium]
MGIQSRILSAVVVAAGLHFAQTGAASAAETCTIKTARQSAASPEVLCECGSVTSGMLRYIQRRADFDNFLARTGAECPNLAALLSDIPTASINANEQRSGDGDPNGGGGGGGGGGNPDGDPDDTPEDRDKKERDKKKKDKKN